MEISKTTVTVTVLHRSDDPLPTELSGVLYEMDEGGAVGWETGRTTVVVPANQVHDELTALGNDGTFFDADDDDADRLGSLYDRFAQLADIRLDGKRTDKANRLAAEYVHLWLTEHGLQSVRVDDENEIPSYALLDGGEEDEELNHAVGWLPRRVFSNPTRPAWNPVVTVEDLSAYLGEF